MNNKNIYIIGSGIIGLSTAEYFSRSVHKVTIISNDNPLAGSTAAAANLATKGQIFARDPHFQMKLDAKKIYPSWIHNLIAECSFPYNINSFFKIGQGIDTFYNQTDRDKHLKRVLQNKEELFARCLPTDHIQPHEENSIIYQEEAWVDASILIHLLKSVLKKRGVHFIHSPFSKKSLEEISLNKEGALIVFCTGAWTKQLLTGLGLPLSDGFKKPERLTLGSTFKGDDTLKNKDFVLYEKIDERLKHKITFSGNQYISSSSLKIQAPSNLNETVHLYQTDLKRKNEKLFMLGCLNPSLLHERTGLRVGYGHSEILIESVVVSSTNIQAVACCGAHKSGFLFAPVLGKQVEKFLYS